MELRALCREDQELMGLVLGVLVASADSLWHHILHGPKQEKPLAAESPESLEPPAASLGMATRPSSAGWKSVRWLDASRAPAAEALHAQYRPLFWGATSTALGHRLGLPHCGAGGAMATARELSCALAQGRPPGSPCLRLQVLGCCLATAQAACSWLMGRAFRYLAAWALPQFLLVTQGDLQLLKTETDRLVVVVSETFPEPGDVPPQLPPAPLCHQEHHLCQQIRSMAASIQLFSGEVLKLFSTDCKRMSAEIFDQTMPLGKHWRVGLRADLPSSPSEYAAAAAQAVLGQVLQGAQLLPRDAQAPALARVTTAFLEAWMDHILAQRIKFSLQGALQLRQDFELVRELVGSERYGLAPETRQSLLSLRVFQQMDGAILCLLQQPGGVTSVAPRPWHSLRRCCSDNGAHPQEPAAGSLHGLETLEEKLLHEARLKAKAKRRLRRTSSRDSTRESLSEGGEPGPEPGSPKGRAHDRRSRMGKGRGLPKKGGAGGKGVWGAPGVVYGYQEPDARDPNYDEAAQGDTVYATVVPELEEGELEKNVQPMVMEYFEHGDTSEVMVRRGGGPQDRELLRGLNLGSRRHAVPSLAVALALEGKASHRELTSRLLSDLVGHVVTPEDIAWAFDKMLQDLPDLILDTPEAPQVPADMLGQFIARAVADHALPLDFLERYKGRVDCEHARAALDRAAVLLRIKRDVNRLDNVWGVGGGQRPVKHLVKEMNLLLREYLLSGEVSEAEHCLRELEVPHFHHELVYEAVVMVLEGSGEGPVAMMVTLLKVLWETGLVTLDQMNRGFQRVYEELGDISLDVPLAHSLLERLVELCFDRGIITKALRDACPARGRKRFVSEGDGGQVKQ
ncbi:programmed cell death protein 4-like [Limosa lapponica baueri]|uniref:Programmed cell death protein 4 n=11 Tax=Charadriiformes TaxID=8906 RepID=A0A2I0UL62_LIMLA|nr:programmed cell death protein 4-like [Limosa lapponica baueri]